MLKRVLLLCFVLLWGCSKGTVRESTDLLEIRALQGIIDKLQLAYEKRDIEAFLASFSPDSQDTGRIRTEIETGFKSYPDRRVSLVPKRIWIRAQDASVTVSWEGSWTVPPPNEPLKKNGVALFLFVKSGKEEYRVSEIRGENPFWVD